jgi:radical SAM protein with 4Fe4S-binding SPASM domain
MRFIFDQNNYKTLLQLAEVYRQNKVERIEIEPTNQSEDLPKFSEIIPLIYQVLDYELFFKVWLKNFPYCIINDFSRDHIIPMATKAKGKKLEKCQDCKYNNICLGFPKGYFAQYGEKEVRPIKDLPCEVMIEAEARCNFHCQFCFNKNSFAKQGRNTISFTTEYVKRIIDQVVKAGIKVFRFTGGEPLLREDIFELMTYAKRRGLEVRLNTNASLINLKNIDKFKGIVDNVLIPIESWSNEKESEITGFNNSLKRKITAIKLLKKIKVPIVRVGTVAFQENIENFNKLASLLLTLPIDEWEFYRPISRKRDGQILNKTEIEKLVDKIIDLRKKTDKYITIANSIPFCALRNPNKLNFVSRGALFEDGHSRLVIDPRGFVKPHYFIDKNIGDPLDILSAWHHPFMEKIRNLKFLPKECRDCGFRFKCRGGSRFEAKLTSGNYQSLDPLAQPRYKAK